MSEQWRAVPGYEGWYEVSDHGNVRSLDRVVPHSAKGQMRLRGALLKPRYNRGGYAEVRLCRQRVTVHRLVASVFIPNPEAHLLVLHADDNPANNHVSNLRWGTKSDNEKDKVRNGNGTQPREACPNNHPYTPENTYETKQGRRCLTCSREGQRRRYQERKAHAM